MPEPLESVLPPHLPILGNVPRSEARAILLSLLAGILLLAVKFAAYYLTSSTAVLSDAMESIVNVLASCFALYALRLAHLPADEKHPYGHGKVEFLSAGFEGGMVFLAALYIFVHVIYQFFNPRPLERVETAMGLMLLATVVNGVIGFILIRAGKRNHSLTLEADGQHLLADAITSIAVLISLLLVKFTHSTLPDPITAILVSVYLVILAMRLLRRSTAGLMDEQDAADTTLIQSILDKHLPPEWNFPAHLLLPQTPPPPFRPLSLDRHAPGRPPQPHHHQRPRTRQPDRIRNRTSARDGERNCSRRALHRSGAPALISNRRLQIENRKSRIPRKNQCFFHITP